MDLSKIAKLLGSKGGKKSAAVRFKDMTPEQKSEYMKWVRKVQKDDLQKATDNLNGPVGQKATIDFLREIGQIKD